jgi:hypothetical protein
LSEDAGKSVCVNRIVTVGAKKVLDNSAHSRRNEAIALLLPLERVQFGLNAVRFEMRKSCPTLTSLPDVLASHRE